MEKVPSLRRVTLLFMNPLKFRFLWTLIGYGLVLLVVVLSLSPAPSPLVSFPWMDKLLHVVAYGVLMLWFAQLHPRSRYGWLAGGFVMLGILLEVLQSYTGYRSGDYGDVAANSLGTALSWGLACNGMNTLLHRLRVVRANRTLSCVA